MQRPHSAWPSRAGKPCSGSEIRAGEDRGVGLILGAIIAGGGARRFGSDKAAALLGERALIDHAIAAITPLVTSIIVCGRAWPGYPEVPDIPEPGLGPLGGIAGALQHANARGFAHVLTIGCDMPGIPESLIARLVACRPSFCSDSPLMGCWPSSAGEALVARLHGRPETDFPLEPGGKNPALSVRAWARSIDAVAVAAGVPLPNVNTPADLLAL